MEKNDPNSNNQIHLELFKEDVEMERCDTNPGLNMEILTTSENENNNGQRIKTSVNKKRVNFLFDDNKDKYTEDLNNLDKKMDNIQESIKVEFINQANNFSEIKRKKLERISSKKSKKNNILFILFITSYKTRFREYTKGS